METSGREATVSEGSASTGIGHVSDWLTSCSACLCGFCHRTMEGLESIGSFCGHSESETSKLPAAASWGDLRRTMAVSPTPPTQQ